MNRLSPNKQIMKQAVLVLALSLGFGWSAIAQAGKVLYENNFEKAGVDKVPEDMLVLDGGFAVKQEGDSKVLELPGAPLETFGVLFGPTEAANVEATARLFATGKGRRFPVFGVGLNGVGGYKLQIAPGKKQIELVKGEDIVASKEFEWTGNNSWTVMRLQVRKTGEGVQVEGKAWKQGAEEPKDWQIAYTDKSPAPAGRASIWGNPFSGTPIRFDDLKMLSVGDK
jgi:hypothetical protein